MSRGLLKICLIITAMTVVAFPTFSRKRNDLAKPFLEAGINRSNVVEGEVLIYEVTLFTPDPDIAGIELAGNPFFNNLPVSRSAADNRLEETEVDGAKYYTAVIDRCFVDANIIGKHKLRGGSYRIGFIRRTPVEDPFWGPYVSEELDVAVLEAPDVAVSVGALPIKGKPEDFSGAIGLYDIEVMIPFGDLHVGDEACAIVTISGNGDLSQASLPEIRSIFDDGLQFRSMTESRSHFMKEGKIGSEIEIECIFSPQREGEYEIGVCTFSFFNPESRRYEKAASDSVSVRILPASISKDSPTHYMDI